MGTTEYDAIVVGSGATGGWAAKVLSEKGLKVLVLEAGRKIDPSKEYTDHEWPYELPYRGFGNQAELQKTQPVQSLCYACNEYGHQFFVNDLENPYTTPPDKPFTWIRSRQVGGRSIPWGRQSYRFSDYDFKAATRDGYGEPWPVSYADIAPYYDRVEEFVGVSGSYENMPQLPDGKFLPPMDLTCGEHILRKAVAKMNDPHRRVIIGLAAILTKTIHENTPDERAACHWCGHCDRGCITYSYYCSATSTIPAAERTGNMTLVPHAVVSHVILDKQTGKAKGVHYVDGQTRAQREAFARLIVLCAGTLESTRILLNSPTLDGHDGIANSSGALGHYLMDHVMGAGAGGALLTLDSKYLAQDGRANGIYIPRFRNLDEQNGKFLRGYGYQGGASQALYEHGKSLPGFGAGLKKMIREYHPWGIGVGAFAECLSRYENHVRINKDVVDAWGIPALHIEMAFGDNERKLVEDAAEQAGEMLEAAGAKYVEVSKGPLSTPGLAIHEVGTARMGDDPKKSVLNKFNQAHDVKNLFVTDGAAFVSTACQNPTLTMMAFTTRACEYAAEELRAGRL
jgi:choline dehydrogenase-like flavoprotein